MSLAVSLVCSSFARSLRFYTDVLGFTTMRFEPALRWAELERDGVAITLQEDTSSALGALEYPFGRGVMLLVWTHDVDAVYAGVQAYGARLHRPLQEVWREEDGSRVGHLAFEVIDPDGYALRFSQALPPQRG
jgi:catechol 2,3-dioxygenase-like lactoylglutathione lyase family enzyme